MSDWEYDQYIGADWNKDLELKCPGGRDGMILLKPDGTLEVGAQDYGSCCGGGSMNTQFGRLTLDQAIEIQAYLTQVIHVLTVVDKMKAGAKEELERLQGERDAGAIP